MKNDSGYTDKEIESWCNVFDQDIVEDIWTSQMIFEEIEFRQFLEMYQIKHLRKYGSFLTLKN